MKNDNGITFLIPARFNAQQIQRVNSNGANQPYAVEPLKGTVYAWVTVKPGFDYHIEVIYH